MSKLFNTDTKGVELSFCITEVSVSEVESTKWTVHNMEVSVMKVSVRRGLTTKEGHQKVFFSNFSTKDLGKRRQWKFRILSFKHEEQSCLETLQHYKIVDLNNIIITNNQATLSVLCKQKLVYLCLYCPYACWHVGQQRNQFGSF